MQKRERLNKFRITPYQAVVLIMNVLTCPEASNDADRTVEELIRELNKTSMNMDIDVVESALYCCNMNDEEGKFWHPRPGWRFRKFLKAWFPPGYIFDFDYNNIRRGDVWPKRSVSTQIENEKPDDQS